MLCPFGTCTFVGASRYVRPATGWGGPGLIFRQGQETVPFLETVRTDCEVHPVLFSGCRGSLPTVERAGCEVGYSPVFSAYVKNEWT